MITSALLFCIVCWFRLAFDVKQWRVRLKLFIQFLLFFSSEKNEKDINLVDPASSHTLVSKIKPCMSKYKQLCTVKLRMAHYISYSLLDSTLLLG